MRSITRLFSAFGTLADSVLALASVIDTAAAKIRLQLGSETEPPALMHGEVIDATEETTPSMKRNKAKQLPRCR
jgi:hypothetical protein